MPPLRIDRVDHAERGQRARRPAGCRRAPQPRVDHRTPTADVHIIEVMMKPLPSVTITASSGRPWPSPHHQLGEVLRRDHEPGLPTLIASM